jgi:hypothetical protein
MMCYRDNLNLAVAETVDETKWKVGEEITAGFLQVERPLAGNLLQPF